MKPISSIYKELVPLLRHTADYMEEGNTDKRDEVIPDIKQAYILISECVKHVGLNTTRHIWSKEELILLGTDEMDEDDI